MTKHRPRRVIAQFAIGVVAALFVGELALWLAHPAIPSPLQWPNRTAEAKHELLGSLDESFPEVVFVGSSTVAAALDPSVFTAECGRSAFNAAIDGASPVALEVWLRKAVLGSGVPDWVVIGLTSRELRPSEDVNSYAEALAARDDPLARVERALAARSRVIEYRSVLRDPARWVPWAPPEDDTLNADGYPGNEDGSYSLAEFAGASAGLLADYEPSRVELDAVRRIVQDLHDLGVGVVLANMAVSEDWPELHPHGARDHDDYSAAVEATAAELEVPFIDLDEFDHPRFFHDPIHVDAEGSLVATRALASRFPDCE